MKNYSVTIPIAGHIVVDVEAENEEEAKEKALMMNHKTEQIESWETLDRFCQGNVCYCPSPWEIEAEEWDD